jgi:hypothetical protein
MKKGGNSMKKKLQKVASEARAFWQDESGMGTIEVVLIIVVLVGLVIVFKKQISGLVKDIISHIKSDAQTVYN